MKTHFSISNEISKSSFKTILLAKNSWVVFIMLLLLPVVSFQAQNKVSNNTDIQSEKQSKPQDALLKGMVSSKSGPLAGVNIVLKDTRIGATTNFEGEFSFPKLLKAGDVLVVSYLGYETQKIVIGKNQKPLNIVLIADDMYILGAVETNAVYSSKGR